MDFQARMAAILAASPEVLARVDAILEGRDQPEEMGNERTKLFTMGEACKYIGWSYSKLYRAIKDGLLTPCSPMGNVMLREQELYELSLGVRCPSAEVLARREARNAVRRQQYKEKMEMRA